MREIEVGYKYPERIIKKELMKLIDTFDGLASAHSWIYSWVRRLLRYKSLFFYTKYTIINISTLKTKHMELQQVIKAKTKLPLLRKMFKVKYKSTQYIP